MSGEPIRVHVDPDSGVRYLEPVVYEKDERNGRHYGWRATGSHERERWDNPPRVDQPAAKPAEQPKPIQTLVVTLEDWLDLTPPLERQLRAVYELEPLRVSRLATTIVEGATSRRLTNPAGLLVTRLREIASNQPLPEIDHDEVRDDTRRRDQDAASASAQGAGEAEMDAPLQRQLEARSDGLALALQDEARDTWWESIAP